MVQGALLPAGCFSGVAVRHATVNPPLELTLSQLPQALTSVEKGLLYCVQTLSWLLHTLWSAMRPAFMVATFDPALSLEMGYRLSTTPQ